MGAGTSDPRPLNIDFQWWQLRPQIFEIDVARTDQRNNFQEDKDHEPDPDPNPNPNPNLTSTMTLTRPGSVFLPSSEVQRFSFTLCFSRSLSASLVHSLLLSLPSPTDLQSCPGNETFTETTPAVLSSRQCSSVQCALSC